MLHLRTISPSLLTFIRRICDQQEFNTFRLVGGTALSLLYGHRISVDADFFTQTSFDKREIEQMLVQGFPQIQKIHETTYGFTWTYQDIKVDFYDWKVPFLKPPLFEDGIRLAAPEDLAAFKLDAVVGRKTEKDFRDIARLLDVYNLEQLLQFYQKKYPYSNVKLVLDHLASVRRVNPEADLILLDPIPWQQIEEKINRSVSSYFDNLLRQREQAEREREQRLIDLFLRKDKPESET